ncbi:MAG: class I SAM-dependent methyltransferase [Ginsengibacter sp.]
MSLKKDSTFSSNVNLKICSLLPLNVLKIVSSEINPRSVLDVGCGTGASLNFFLENGVDAKGLENSDYAIENSPVKAHIYKHNLNRPYLSDKQYDLVWSFEVIEHIHPKYEDIFLNTLVNHSDQILISAARPGQGGHGHFNEQEPEYWINRFKDLGYDYDNDFSKKLQSTGDAYVENVLFFKKNCSKKIFITNSHNLKKG